MIGANGVLNRVAEDGVLLDSFRKLHHKFGTTFRIINFITVLQIATIVLSRGDVYLLGEAYAFGVVWSFALKALGVLALRFQRQRSRVQGPGQLSHRQGKRFRLGWRPPRWSCWLRRVVNLFSKQYATMYGIGFTIAFFILFTSSHIIRKAPVLTRKGRLWRRRRHEQLLEEFNLQQQPRSDHDSSSCQARLRACCRTKPGKHAASAADAAEDGSAP